MYPYTAENLNKILLLTIMHRKEFTKIQLICFHRIVKNIDVAVGAPKILAQDDETDSYDKTLFSLFPTSSPGISSKCAREDI